MNTRVEAPNQWRESLATLGALVQLTKPGVTRLVLVTTWFGAVLAEGSVRLAPMLLTLVGTVLVVAAANALNMVAEQETDALMERTRNRPLPTGRLSRDVALGFGLLLGAAGLTILLVGVNLLTAALAAFSLIVYVLVYTPMKAKSSLALYVGAVPGAMPPVLGYTGLAGELTPDACAAFALLFTWQIPHFLAISVFRESEYRAAGLQVMSVERGIQQTSWAIVVSSFILLGVSLAPWVVGLGGQLYLGVALLAGGAFSLWALLGKRVRQTRRGVSEKAGASEKRSIDGWAKSVFFASMPYLVVLFTVLGITAP